LPFRFFLATLQFWELLLAMGEKGKSSAQNFVDAASRGKMGEKHL